MGRMMNPEVSVNANFQVRLGVEQPLLTHDNYLRPRLNVLIGRTVPSSWNTARFNAFAEQKLDQNMKLAIARVLQLGCGR